MTTNTALGATNSTLPSFALRAAACAPMTAPAPGLFSTITGWPSFVDRPSA